MRPDLFVYDAKAAREARLFFRQYLKLTGDFEGLPFVVLEWFAEVLDAVYGWRWRDGPRKGQRRFRIVYIDGPKRLGKSPCLAGWGIYHLFFERYVRPYIISASATYKQAVIVFRAAKDMLELSPRLVARAKVLDKAIRVPHAGGLWEIASSLNKAPSGYAPSMTLFDELHEVPGNAGAGLDKAERNAKKRRDSLFVVATNTGDDMESPWGVWRERAEKVLSGEKEELDFLPAIFAAAKEADISSPETWKAANPAIGTIASLADYQSDYEKTIGNKGQELAFRRLGLGQVVQDEHAWIDYERWKKCLVDEIPEDVKRESELYLGFDLGPIRDITGNAFAFVHRPTNHVWVEVDQLLPLAAAKEYEESHLVPYSRWSTTVDDDGKPRRPDIELIDVRAIDAEPQIALAAKVAAKAKAWDVRLCCYDRLKADHFVYALEKTHGLPCEPISQTTFGLGPACRDFEARIFAGSISIVRNACLNWQARHIAVITDRTGFVVPVKPGHGKTKGNAWKKIDGIVAILNALARATRITDAPIAKQIANWTGRLRPAAPADR